MWEMEKEFLPAGYKKTEFTVILYSLTSLVQHSLRRHPRYYDTFLRDQTS